MLILTNSGTDKLQLVTSAAVNIDVHVSWADLNGTTVTPGRTNTAITTATTTDICATPAASTTRNVKGMTIRNKGSASCDVTVVYDQNGTDFELHQATLLAGDMLEFVEGVGFFLVTPTARLNLMLRVASDLVYNTAATLADVTGLTCALKSGKRYAFQAKIFNISAASTTGAQFGVNYSSTATLVIAASLAGVTNSVTAAAVSIGSATALNTVIAAQTTGSASITWTDISGFINPSGDGTFAVRASAEVAANMTVKAGSWLLIRECDN